MSFSKSLDNSAAGKTDSGAFKGKIDLRQRVMESIDSPSVFDAYAGSGGMYRSVWHKAERYVGCDKRYFPDERMAYVADNRRVMRAIDLSGFNIFDLDAYGSPWEQAIILAARRQVKGCERIGICLTEGTGLNMKMGGLSLAQRILTGIKKPPAGLSKNQDLIIDRCAEGLARLMNCRILSYWKMRGKKGSAMRYLGLILEAV